MMNGKSKEESLNPVIKLGSFYHICRANSRIMSSSVFAVMISILPP